LTDTLLLTSAIIELGPPLEALRISEKSSNVFSYRFKLGKSGAIFDPSRNFANWLAFQQFYLSKNPDISHVLKADISDFYFRKLKPGFDQLGSDEKYAFLMGASCLPEGELGPFVKDVAKSPDDPLLKVFCGWLLSHKDKVLN
jgi:hypothetical protein